MKREEMKKIILEREAKIVADRYEGKSLHEIGVELNLTRERIRQLRNEIEKTTPQVLLKSLNARYDWRAIAELREIMRISHAEIADNLGCFKLTVVKILSGTAEYSTTSPNYNSSKLTDGLKFRVLMYILDEAVRRVESVDKNLSLVLNRFLSN